MLWPLRGPRAAASARRASSRQAPLCRHVLGLAPALAGRVLTAMAARAPQAAAHRTKLAYSKVQSWVDRERAGGGYLARHRPMLIQGESPHAAKLATAAAAAASVSSRTTAPRLQPRGVLPTATATGGAAFMLMNGSRRQQLSRRPRRFSGSGAAPAAGSGLGLQPAAAARFVRRQQRSLPPQQH